MVKTINSLFKRTKFRTFIWNERWSCWRWLCSSNSNGTDNLHFTGDFHAITSAHNLLSALIDNHIYWGNKLNIDPNNIVWKRVIDLNDRALRKIEINLEKLKANTPRKDSFDITVASEVMAIFCLSNNIQELEEKMEILL